MMGPRQIDQAALFYEFSLERHVPATHLLRSIDRFVDLSDVRSHLAPFYSSTGRPSIDPELLVRMLLVGYCYGIRSERRLCEEVHLNLAYRWFCRLGLDGEVPDTRPSPRKVICTHRSSARRHEPAGGAARDLLAPSLSDRLGFSLRLAAAGVAEPQVLEGRPQNARRPPGFPSGSSVA